VLKDPLFKKEKESARITARCHVSLEKSSKNYIHCESEPSQAAIHSGELWRVYIVEQGYIRDPE
jgi:SH3-like domain-containing protein